MKKIKTLSIDVEATSLVGEPFAVGFAVCYDDYKYEKYYFAFDPKKENIVVDPWVEENVLCHFGKEKMEYNCSSQKEFWEETIRCYLSIKERSTYDFVETAHMQTPVEGHFFHKMINEGLKLGLKDNVFWGPFPLHETATLLKAHAYEPTSINEYCTKKGLLMCFQLETHNPADDAVENLIAWEYLKNNSTLRN